MPCTYTPYTIARFPYQNGNFHCISLAHYVVLSMAEKCNFKLIALVHWIGKESEFCSTLPLYGTSIAGNVCALVITAINVIPYLERLCRKHVLILKTNE